MLPTSPPSQRVKWSKRERALIYQHDGTVEVCRQDGTVVEQTASNATGALIAFALETKDVFQGQSLVQALEARGYDITTFKMSVRMRKP